MKNTQYSFFFLLFSLLLSAQQNAYYQQHANYKMDIDVDAANYTFQGKQSIEYTNNSPDELNVIYFNLYWNAFKPGSMMDQRVQYQGKNGNFTTLPIWSWTQREYTFTIPYTKDQLTVLGIDFSQRLADVNQADNIVEVK